jgi:hypothetical protein
MWRDGLSVIALDSKSASHTSDYLTFDEASASGALDIHEAAAQSVPVVEAVTGPAKVLLLGGDTIIGGAQNRIINVTVLLKAAAKTAIPVSCLELGRWNDGRRFTASRPVDHNMRRMVAEQVAAVESGASATSRFATDQGAIWHEISQRQLRAGLSSATDALHDVYRAEEQSLEAFGRAFPMPETARGIAVGLFDRLVGLDMFDSAETLGRQWPRLIASAASALLDAQRGIASGVLTTPSHGRLHSAALDRMLKRARDGARTASVNPSVGEGSDVRFQGVKVVGTALVDGGRVIHLALFRRS